MLYTSPIATQDLIGTYNSFKTLVTQIASQIVFDSGPPGANWTLAFRIAGFPKVLRFYTSTYNSAGVAGAYVCDSVDAAGAPLGVTKLIQVRTFSAAGPSCWYAVIRPTYKILHLRLPGNSTYPSEWTCVMAQGQDGQWYLAAVARDTGYYYWLRPQRVATNGTLFSVDIWGLSAHRLLMPSGHFAATPIYVVEQDGNLITTLANLCTLHMPLALGAGTYNLIFENGNDVIVPAGTLGALADGYADANGLLPSGRTWLLCVDGNV